MIYFPPNGSLVAFKSDHGFDSSYALRVLFTSDVPRRFWNLPNASASVTRYPINSENVLKCTDENLSDRREHR